MEEPRFDPGPIAAVDAAEILRRRRQAQRRLRTIADPEAMAILTSLSREPQTSAELADELGIDDEAARRCLRRLGRTAQVVKTGRTRRRGRIEQLYSVDHRVGLIAPEDLAGAPPRLIDEATLVVLRTMFREAVDAIDAGTFESRADSCSVRFLASLDEPGFRRAIDLHRELLLDVVDEVETAGARLAVGGETPIWASAQILLCEYPTERPVEPASETRSARRSSRTDRVGRALALMDPFRIRLLNTLIVGPATAGDLAARLGVGVEKMRYELDRLLDDRLVRVIRRRPSRGTSERVFVWNARGNILSADDLSSHAGNGARALSGWIVRSVFGEALETIRGAAHRSSDDAVIARVNMALDAEGFAAISARTEAVLKELIELSDRCYEELGEGEAPARFALSGLLLFERAPGRREAR